MNVGWKVYFWFIAVISIVCIPLDIIAYKKFSSGDWIDVLLSILTVFALYVFAYKKRFIKPLFWKVIFWSIIGLLFIRILSSFAPFTFLSHIFIGVYNTSVSSQYGSPWLMLSLEIPCIVASIPIWYAFFALGYKQYWKKDGLTIPEDVSYSGLTVASLITGIIGLLLGPLFTIPALITGIMGLREIKKRKIKGAGYAWFGIFSFYLNMTFLIVLVAIVAYVVKLPGVLTTYQDAVKHMSKVELKYYNEKLSKVKQDSGNDDVEKILGKPTTTSTSGNDTTYTYPCPEKTTPQCSITITITNNAVSNISWTEFKRFMYTRKFSDLDKTYIFDTTHVTLTLEPGWSEYVYSQKELQDHPDAPVTFTKKNGNTFYEFVVKNKDEGTYQLTYIVSPKVVVLVSYYSPTGKSNASELSDISNIINTIAIEEK